MKYYDDNQNIRQLTPLLSHMADHITCSLAPPTVHTLIMSERHVPAAQLQTLSIINSTCPRGHSKEYVMQANSGMDRVFATRPRCRPALANHTCGQSRTFAAVRL